MGTVEVEDKNRSDRRKILKKMIALSNDILTRKKLQNQTNVVIYLIFVFACHLPTLS